MSEEVALFSQHATWLDFSSDLSHLAFAMHGIDVPSASLGSGPTNLYLAGPDPFVEPVWLDGPSVETPLTGNVVLLGGSPDLSTIFFAYSGGLLPEDLIRAKGQQGVYEYRNGVLSEAGVLPDGKVSENGALPIAAVIQGKSGEYLAASSDNQVSLDGKRVFFVAYPPTNKDKPELYVHVIGVDGGGEHGARVGV